MLAIPFLSGGMVTSCLNIDVLEFLSNCNYGRSFRRVDFCSLRAEAFSYTIFEKEEKNMMEMIITAAVAVMLTGLKCACQAQSIMEINDNDEESISAFSIMFSIVLHGIICVALIRYAGGEMLWSAIYICWIILGIVALLSIFNREGSHRRDSWTCLILLYGLALAMALAKRADADVLTTANIVASAIIFVAVLFVNIFSCYCYENGVFEVMREGYEEGKAKAESSH